MTRRRSSVRRGGNGGFDPLHDQPWWVRATMIVGLPTALLAGLLYFHFNAFQTMVDDVEANGRTLSTLSDQMWIMIGINQRLCIHTARNDDEELQCATLDVRSGP